MIYITFASENHIPTFSIVWLIFTKILKKISCKMKLQYLEFEIIVHKGCAFRGKNWNFSILRSTVNSVPKNLMEGIQHDPHSTLLEKSYLVHEQM